MYILVIFIVFLVYLNKIIFITNSVRPAATEDPGNNPFNPNNENMQRFTAPTLLPFLTLLPARRYQTLQERPGGSRHVLLSAWEERERTNNYYLSAKKVVKANWDWWWGWWNQRIRMVEAHRTADMKGWVNAIFVHTNKLTCQVGPALLKANQTRHWCVGPAYCNHVLMIGGVGVSHSLSLFFCCCCYFQLYKYIVGCIYTKYFKIWNF